MLSEAKHLWLLASSLATNGCPEIPFPRLRNQNEKLPRKTVDLTLLIAQQLAQRNSSSLLQPGLSIPMVASL
jgi:hypothetical protein